MTFPIPYENALVNRGNQYRLKQAMKKAAAGEHLTIGFLGGSITQGSLASRPEYCYAMRVFAWWKETFPEADFTFVNAGIGATDSQFGCARAREDLLSYHPDVISVEFAVNDESNEHYLETFEGLIRQLYQAEGEPALYTFYNVCYDNGANAQLQHAKIARRYQIPAISMQSTIYPMLLSGVYENAEITPDNLHPNDLGHEMVASVITHVLAQIHEQMDEAEAQPDPMPQPLTLNAYENSVRYRNRNARLLSVSGWEPDETKQEIITDIFKNGWTASRHGASIAFEVEGSCIGVQYRRTIQLPAPIAKVVVDGDEEHAVFLDGNFDETWGDKLVLDTVLDHGEYKKHQVEIQLFETHSEDRLPFYLVSLIGSGQ